MERQGRGGRMRSNFINKKDVLLILWFGIGKGKYVEMSQG
jgi:hypothetical protein